MRSFRSSMFRIALIALNSAREAIRQRLFHVVALVAALLVVSSQWLGDLNFGSSELKFIADFGFGALALFGSALSIVATAQLFFSEIEHRTALTLMARPIWRIEFITGKFLGVLAVIGSFSVILTGVLVSVLWCRESMLMSQVPEVFAHGRAVDYSAVIGAGFAQALKFCLLSALTLLVATYARSQLFATASGFMILAICHLQFLSQSAVVGTAGGGGRLLARVVAVSLPNFQRFDFSNSIGSGDGIGWVQLAQLTFYTMIYAAATCILASFVFGRREI